MARELSVENASTRIAGAHAGCAIRARAHPVNAAVRTHWFANAYLLLTLTTVFWAGNAIAGKLAAGVVTPATLTFLRWLLASLLIVFLARARLHRDLRTLRRHWLLVFLLGGLGFAAFNLLLYGALNYTSAINVTIEQSAMPVMVMVVNFIAFRQRIRALQALGVVVTILGVVVTATRGAPLTLLDVGINRGDAIMMGAVLLYALYTVALRLKPQVHWMSLLAAMAISALVFATPFFIHEVARGDFIAPGLRGWTIIAYTAVFPSVMSQLFFMRGVELIGANRAALFINLVPIFGSLLAVVLLGEAFRAHHLLALMLVFSGIWMAERFGR
jgi:drug/metabolite transporter (DMT)-like permease